MTKRYAKGEYEKWLAFVEAERSDYRSPLIGRLAMHCTMLAAQRPEWTAKLAAALARDCIEYQTDLARVGREHLGSPDDAWRRGVDDCDAKARLFVALCIAAGLSASLVPKWQENERGELWLSHVSAKVRLGGKWQPVELTLKRAQVGDTPERVPFERETGKWLR